MMGSSLTQFPSVEIDYDQLKLVLVKFQSKLSACYVIPRDQARNLGLVGFPTLVISFQEASGGNEFVPSSIENHCAKQGVYGVKVYVEYELPQEANLCELANLLEEVKFTNAVVKEYP